MQYEISSSLSLHALHESIHDMYIIKHAKCVYVVGKLKLSRYSNNDTELLKKQLFLKKTQTHEIFKYSSITSSYLYACDKNVWRESA